MTSPTQDKRSLRHPEHGDNVSALVVASLSGLVINLLSSFFSGAVAIIVMLVCFLVLIAVYMRSRATGQDVPNWVALIGSVETTIFLATAVVVGGILGGISILPLFPNRYFAVPWTRVFDPEALEYSANFAAYELLAAGMVAALSCFALLRGQDFVRVLGFVIAAMGGAVAVFSALAPDFGSPVQTFMGWSIAVCLALGGLALAPRGIRSMTSFFRLR
jgi:hypothetical protein